MTAILDRVRRGELRRRPSDFGYGAFISYSGGRDRDLIPQIQRGVEKLATRWYRRPSMRVFLDKTSISAGPKLWSKIEQGLARSAWLIVMASPEAAASEWVDREIRWWLEHRAVDTMLLVLTDGTLSWDESINDFDAGCTALPPCLRGVFNDEPVWVSVSWLEDSGKRVPDLERVVLDIAAVIRGIPKDDLASAALREHRRTMRWAGGAVVVLTVLLVAALVFATATVRQRDRADRNFRQATASRLAQDSRNLLSDPQHREDVRGIQEALAADSLSTDLPLLLQTLQSTPDINKIIKTGKEYITGMDLAASLDPRERRVVYSTAFSPDGSRLVTAGAQVRLWNTVTGQQEAQFDTPLLALSVAVSPDGHRIVTGGFEMRLWDDTGKSVAPPLEGHHGVVDSVAFSPDGRRIASAGRDGTVRLWNADNGLPIGQPMAGHSGAASAVAFSPDGVHVISGGADHTVRIWDAATQTPIGRPVDVGNEVTALAVSGQDGRVATAEMGGTVHLFDASASTPGDPLPKSGQLALAAIAFSPNGQGLIAGGTEGAIQIWNVESREHLGTGNGHTGWITSLTFSRDGARIASSSFDGTVRLWNATTHRGAGHQVVGPGSPDGAPPIAQSVAMSPDSARMAAGYSDGSLWIFDTDSGRPVMPPMRSDSGAVERTQFSPDGHRIATAGHDRKIRVWDADTGRAVAVSAPEHTDTIAQLIFSPDGRRLLSTSGDHTTRLWDIESPSFVGTALTGTDDYLNNITFSPDGRLIAGGGSDHTVRLWNAQTGAPTGPQLTGHRDIVARVAFSPDGRRLVSMSQDSLRLWDTSNWQLIGQPHLGPNIFGSLAVSPAGGFFVTGGMGSLRRWDMNTGEQIGDPMPGHQNGIGDVAVSSDGRYIASGSLDATLRIWDAGSGLPVGDPMQAGSQSVAMLTMRADRRILSMNMNLSSDNTLSAWVWPAPAAWRDDLCGKLSYNMSERQWAEWVSPDIQYRDLCKNLPRLADDG